MVSEDVSSAVECTVSVAVGNGLVADSACYIFRRVRKIARRDY
jgi:hypothetical protein